MAGLKRQGIAVHTDVSVAGVKPGKASVAFSYGEDSAEADYLVIATGRGADNDPHGATALFRFHVQG